MFEMEEDRHRFAYNVGPCDVAAESCLCSRLLAGPSKASLRAQARLATDVITSTSVSAELSARTLLDFAFVECEVYEFGFDRGSSSRVFVQDYSQFHLLDTDATITFKIRIWNGLKSLKCQLARDVEIGRIDHECSPQRSQHTNP
jgi:hypothetical protein